MRSQRLLRSLARALPLLVLSLAVPCAVLSQPPAPGSSDLTPEARARLAQAAEDSRLPPWQRDLMQSLARTGNASALGSSAAEGRAALPALAAAGVDGAWNQTLGHARKDHSAIYDPVRDRMVVFGGSPGSLPFLNDVWALSLADTVWTALTPTGTPPSGRAGHSAIYDPVRDWIVVFGGHDGSSYLNDVWILSLAGTPAWTHPTSFGTPPSGRWGHSAIYDPARDRMVVFGGTYYDGSSHYLNDVWALSLVDMVWTALTPPGTPPSVRCDQSAVYDPVRDAMVIFGGLSPSGPCNDVCLLHLTDTTWTQLPIIGGPPPSARYRHSAICDTLRHQMVVFGGVNAFNSSLDEVWALSLDVAPAWTRLAESGIRPHGRDSHSAFYDPARDRMVVYGGHRSYYCDNDVWTLSLPGTPAWAELSPNSPQIRAMHSAIYDPVHDRMVVFGGTGHLSDVWALSLAGRPVWTQLAPSGIPPSGRESHSAIYDPVRDRMVVFGGGWNLSYLNDVWSLSLADTTWTALTPTATPPSVRFGHSAIYDPVRDRMVVFGGSAGSYPYFNDVWALSLAGTPAWTQVTPSGTPPIGRYWHSAIYDPVRDRMVVYGGNPGYDEVWSLSLAGTPAWTRLTPSGTAPSGRRGHSAVYDPVRDRMVVFGGKGSSYFNDVWSLSLSGTPAWTQLTPTGALPFPHQWHSATYDPVRDRMVVFAGKNGSNVEVNDVWALGWNTTQTAVDEPAALPLISRLRAPAPNPTRGTTTVSYILPQAGYVQLDVYDVSGRLVRRLVDGERPAGTETVVWNGMDRSEGRVGAGVYFVRMTGPGFRETRKVILVR